MDAVTIMGLSSIKGIGCQKIGKLRQYITSYHELGSVKENTLKKIFTVEEIEKIRSLDWKCIVESYESLPFEVIAIGKDAYPHSLQQVIPPPLLLYIRGTFSKLKLQKSIAIIGTRKASSYGKTQAHMLARELAQNGIAVISGLARGIDAAAHQGAIDGGGYTIAVLGNGIDFVYPSSHNKLASEICQNGACISEYAPKTPALAHHFPQRNRIVAALSLGIVVIEAPQKSGALITANIGLDLGREIFVVPGNIDDDRHLGGHKLIQQGAKLLTSIDDIFEELPQLQCQKQLTNVFLSKIQLAIWNVLTELPQTIDDIANKTGLKVETVCSELMLMTMEEIVVRANYRYYRSRGVVVLDDE